MLDLSNLDEWGKLPPIFGSTDSKDIPLLIEKLKKTLDKEILEELIYEYMYHQGSVYESTFAIFPYLIEICESSLDLDFRLETLLHLTIALSGFRGETELHGIFKNSQCSPQTVTDIIHSFKDSFKKLVPIADSVMNLIIEKEEEEKCYYLVALAVSYEIYQVSAIFSQCIGAEEYECRCPNCEELFFVWNENGKLFLYRKDPVFYKEQDKYLVYPSSIKLSELSSQISADKNYEWLSYYIKKLNIESLKTIIDYLFGTTICPHCQTHFMIFENIPL